MGLSRQLFALVRGERSSDEWLLDAHFIAVAFRHIEQHLKHLEPHATPSVKDAARGFLEEYNSAEIKTLRDMLEHQVEYIVDAPTTRKENLKYVKDKTSPVTFGGGTGGTEVIYLYVFGRQYRVDPIIRAALKVDDALGAGG